MSIFSSKTLRRTMLVTILLLGQMEVVSLQAQCQYEDIAASEELEENPPVTILIRKRDLSGKLGLFAPAVAPGALICFKGDGSKITVDFQHASPFEGPMSFDISQDGIAKRVRQDAVQAEYLFSIESEALQLTVAEDGISYVGFKVTTSPLTVVTELRASQRQPFKLRFVKSVVNIPVVLSVRRTAAEGVESRADYTYQDRLLESQQTLLTFSLGPPPMVGDQLSITLSDDASGLGQEPNRVEESGGTEVVDIIIEP